MVPYLLMFIISIVLVGVGLNINKRIGRLLIVLGLIIPCVMAALRSLYVGTDTDGYIYNLYKLSRGSKNLFSFFGTAYKWYVQKDYAYNAITYIVGKNNLGFSLLLFIYECLIIFPIYFAFKKLKFSNAGIIVGLSSFYLLLYNVSYNMLRQTLAISFAVLAFAYYISSKNKKEKILSYIFALLGFWFHSTAIVVLPVFWLSKIYISKSFEEKYKITLSITMMAVSIVFIVFHRSILTFIGESGIYPLALYYLKVFSIKDFSFYQTFINILMVAMIIYNKKYLSETKGLYLFVITMSLVNLLISTGLGYFILYSQRIMLYLQYILVFCYIPRIKWETKKDKLVIVSYLGLLLFSWILYFVYMNVHETVPYTLFF